MPLGVASTSFCIAATPGLSHEGIVPFETASFAIARSSRRAASSFFTNGPARSTVLPTSVSRASGVARVETTDLGAAPTSIHGSSFASLRAAAQNFVQPFLSRIPPSSFSRRSRDWSLPMGALLRALLRSWSGSESASVFTFSLSVQRSTSRSSGSRFWTDVRAMPASMRWFRRFWKSITYSPVAGCASTTLPIPQPLVCAQKSPTAKRSESSSVCTALSSGPSAVSPERLSAASSPARSP